MKAKVISNLLKDGQLYEAGSEVELETVEGLEGVVEVLEDSSEKLETEVVVQPKRGRPAKK